MDPNLAKELTQGGLTYSAANNLTKALQASAQTHSVENASVWIPRGSLDAWDAALANASSQLVEVSVLGDSTTFGQTNNGANGYSQNNYAWTSKLRRLAVAAGYPDGGVGITGYDDSASMNPTDNIDANTQGTFTRTDSGCGTTSGSNVVTDTAILTTDIGRKVTPGGGFGGTGFVGSVTAGTSFTVVTTQGGATALNATGTTTANMTFSGDGFAANGFYGPLFNKDAGPANTTQTGFTTVFQGKATTLRIGYMTFTSSAATITYSVNGAGAVTLPLAGGARTANYVTITGLPGGGATNNVLVTVTVAGSCEIWAEWVNSTGVVFHKQGLPGQMLASRLPAAQSAYALGISIGVNPANNALALAGGTGPRNVKLAILLEGINELGLVSSQTDAINKAQALEHGVGAFAAYCKNAGITGVVCSPWWWYFTNAATYAGFFKRSLYSAARANGLVWADVSTVLEPITNAGTYAASFAANPHLNAVGYDAVATWLWNNVLNPATAAR